MRIKQAAPVSFRERAVFVIVALCLSLCRVSAQIDTDNVTLMGRSAIGADDYLTAIHYFNQVIEAKPFLNRPYYYRAYAKFCLDDYRGAEEDCSRAIAINPYQAEVYQLRGLCRIRNGEYAAAVQDYTRTLEELPDDQGSLYNRGLCLLELKRYDEASADMDRLLSRWPGFLRAYTVQAQVRFAEGDTLKGMVWIDSLLARNANNAEAWSFKGRYALDKKSYAEADSCLTKALALRSSNYDDYVARALARHGMNRFGLAIADYDRAIELVPQHFVAHYNRGLLRALVGDDNRAIEDFTFVIDLEPDNTLAVYNRALLRQQTGDYSGAIADFSELIRQYPDFLYGYVARAECRRKAGDIRGALSDESVVAKANLDLVYGKRKRRPVKEVRKRSERSLERYDQLVDNADNDSTGSRFGRLLSNDLFGRVQNKKTERKLLPPFCLTMKTPVEEKGYKPVAFLPELARLANRWPGAALNFAAGTATGQHAADASPQSSIAHRRPPQATVADSLLIEAVACSDAYDYAEALKLLDRAEKAMSGESDELLLRLQKAGLLYRSLHTTRDIAAPSSGKEGNLLLLALGELKRAQLLSPGNQYILYNTGCIYAAMNEPQKALECFTKALETDIRFAEAYFNRGVIRLELGEKEAAQNDLSRAGELGLYRAYALLKQAR